MTKNSAFLDKQIHAATTIVRHIHSFKQPCDKDFIDILTTSSYIFTNIILIANGKMQISPTDSVTGNETHSIKLIEEEIANHPLTVYHYLIRPLR